MPGSSAVGGLVEALGLRGLERRGGDDQLSYLPGVSELS